MYKLKAVETKNSNSYIKNASTFYIPDVSSLLLSLLGLRVSDISHSLASIWFSMEAERNKPLREEGGHNSKQH